MREVVAVIFLLFSTSAFSFSQNRTTIELSAFHDDNFRGKVESNATLLLTALNEGFYQKEWPAIPDSVVTHEGRKILQSLWQTAPFHCLYTKIQTSLVDRFQENTYEVRGITLTISSGTSPSNQEEGILLIDKSGKIDGLYYGLENHRFREIIRARKNLDDLRNRKVILDFIENFRTAYNRKDVAFLDEVFSENALIIVGRVLVADETRAGEVKLNVSDTLVELSRYSKREYLDNLRSVFRNNEYINVGFDSLEVYQHPRLKEIYGVSLVQNWSSTTYVDQGYLFLMVDFREQDRPVIHVRTWQPYTFTRPQDTFDLGHFIIR